MVKITAFAPKDILGDLAQRSSKDPGAPFEADVLAALRVLRRENPPEWQRLRVDLKKSGVRIGDLEAALEEDLEEASFQGVVEELEAWPDPVDGEALGREIYENLKRHVNFEHNADPVALTLWILGSYAMDIWRLFPKVMITSPTKRCGKSTLMEVVESMAYRSLLCSNASTAAIYRLIEMYGPTLLFDEADTFLKDNDEVAGILNSGHARRTASVVRTVGDDHNPVKFSTWCPQVIAGIGTIKDTTMDRSVVISLRRQLADEKKPKLPPELFKSSVDLRRRILRWVLDNKISMRTSTLEPDNFGNDRAQDNWQPLLRVSDALGGKWPDRCRTAYLKKESNKADTVDNDAAIILLEDVYQIFKSLPSREFLSSADLNSNLISIEDRPWSEWRNGRDPISKSGVARLLKPFGISPRLVKIAGTPHRGYQRADIDSTAPRYIPALSSSL